MKNRIHSQFPLKCPLYEYSPNVERFTFPLVRRRTHPHQTSVGCPLGYAERKAGVDTMRAETTFLWMSDLLTLIVQSALLTCISQV